MNSKFYVSLEVARLLKEKGYNEYCNYYHYVKNKEERFVYCRDARNEDFYEWTAKIYTAPTLLEAMDWLDERGTIIIVGWDSRTQKWFFIINRKGDLHACFNSTIDDNGDDYTDRYECMNAAIKRGVELLSKK